MAAFATLFCIHMYKQYIMYRKIMKTDTAHIHMYIQRYSAYKARFDALKHYYKYLPDTNMFI